MRIKILGKYWTLRFVPNLGQNLGMCDIPTAKNKEIVIQAGLPAKEELDVVIHEVAGHGSFPHIDESIINEWASDVAHLLWRMGWRKLTPDQIKELNL